jgi:IS5 family transposase
VRRETGKEDAQIPRRVFISGQKRGVFGVIKRGLRHRSAIEPVIGHLKAEGHLGRCYLKGRAGDAANVILSAVDNFRRILAWLSNLLRLILILYGALSQPQSPTIRLFNGRLLSSFDRSHKLRRNKSRLGSIANAQCAQKRCRMELACPFGEFQPARYVFIGHAQGQERKNLFLPRGQPHCFEFAISWR